MERNLKANQNALEHVLTLHPNIKIVAISDTQFTPDDQFQLLNFVSYREDRAHPGRAGRGGAALFLHPELPAQRIYFHTQLEVVAV